MTKKYTIAIIIVSLAVAILGTFLVLHWVRDVSPEDLEGALMEANASDAAGVELTSAFTLSFEDAVSSTAVRHCLQVEPEIEVGVHQGTSRQQVLVVPAEPLSPDTLYTFVLSDGDSTKSWAFQTGNQVAVASFTPADRSVKVRGNSISFTFDRLLEADLNSIDRFFEIQPQVEGQFYQSGRTLTFTANEGLAAGTVYRVTLKAGLPFVDTASTLGESLSFAFETQGVDNSWCLAGQSAWNSSNQPVFSLTASDGSPLLGRSTAQLYSLSEDEYTSLWKRILEQQPSWSLSFNALSGCVVNGEPIAEFTLNADANGNFSLPQELAAGCYLLRVSRGGSSHDLPFMVSGLAAAALSHGADLLAWVHEVQSGERADKAEVHDLLSGQMVTADNQGVALLSAVGENALLLINARDQRLILPWWQGGAAVGGPLLWRYLYLGQECYQAGGQLCFWGLVQPRDGSPLEYDAVSVYIFDSNNQPVLKQYTPLDSFIFSGQIELPALPAGTYRLAVWQSGRELISRNFALGTTSLASNDRSWTEAANDTDPLLPIGAALDLDSDVYRRGESFAASCQLGEGDYLFLEAERGALNWTASQSGLLADVFQPQSKLDSYCRALCYDNGAYSASDSALLHRDYTDCRLQVSAELTGSDSCTVTVTDGEGAAVPGAAVLFSLMDGAAPEAEPLDLLYGDYSGSGWVGDPVPLGQPTAASCGLNQDFQVLTCDDQGQVEVSWSVPVFDSRAAADSMPAEAGSLVGRYVLLQALAHYIPSADAEHTNLVGSDTQEVVILAGTAGLTLIKPGLIDPEPIDKEQDADAEGGEPQAGPEYTLLSGGQPDAAGGCFQGEGDDSLLIAASTPRTEVLLRLGRLMQSNSKMGKAAAVSLLCRHSGSLASQLLAPLLADGDCQLANYQQLNGSVLDDLHATAALSLISDPAVSVHTLKLYCRQVLVTQPPGPDYTAALAALAVLDEPYLNDVRRLLASGETDPISRYWLVIASALSGDGQAGDYLPPEPAVTGAQAEEWALYGLALASCGEINRSLSMLDRALEQMSAEPDGQHDRTALICAAALSQLLENKKLLAGDREDAYDLTYSVDGEEFNTDFEPEAMFQLPLADFSGELQILSSDGGGFSIFTLREE